VNNLEVLHQALTLEGVESVTVYDPSTVEQAVQNLKQVDVIFLDLELPNTNGFQIFELLQSYPYLKNVPVVAYTVHVSQLLMAHRHGFHSFLGKPLDLDKFPGHLTQILRGEAVWSIP
jgi:CheY-like chemotaxis protein